MKWVSKFSPQIPWFHFEKQGNCVATNLNLTLSCMRRLNCIHWKEWLAHLNAMVNVITYSKSEKRTLFFSSVNHKEYKINHNFNYNDKWFICLLTCNKCQKQYNKKLLIVSAITGTTTIVQIF